MHDTIILTNIIETEIDARYDLSEQDVELLAIVMQVFSHSRLYRVRFHWCVQSDCTIVRRKPAAIGVACRARVKELCKRTTQEAVYVSLFC